jgi:hypothetical protein
MTGGFREYYSFERWEEAGDPRKCHQVLQFGTAGEVKVPVRS